MAICTMTERLSLYDAEKEFRRRYVTATLQEAGGNRTRAAEVLGINRTQMQRIIRDLGVTVECRFNIPPAEETS